MRAFTSNYKGVNVVRGVDKPHKTLEIDAAKVSALIGMMIEAHRKGHVVRFGLVITDETLGQTVIVSSDPEQV